MKNGDWELGLLTFEDENEIKMNKENEINNI